jgi:adenylate cyclase
MDSGQRDRVVRHRGGGLMGRTTEAKEALEKATANAPERFDRFVRERHPGLRPEDHAHMIEGLRKAGMPEE